MKLSQVTKNFDEKIFFLSAFFLITFYNIIYFNTSKSIILFLFFNIFFLFKLINSVEKKYWLILQNIFLGIYFLSSLVAYYDTFGTKSFLTDSKSKAKSFVSFNINKIFQDKKKNNTKKEKTRSNIIVQNILPNDYVLLAKMQSQPIKILNNKFENTDFLKNSNSFKKAFPFYLFPNGDILTSSHFWWGSDRLIKFNRNFEKIWELEKPVHHFADFHDDKLYVPSFVQSTWKDFQKKEKFKKLKNYNCHPNSKKMIDKRLYTYTPDISPLVPGKFKDDRIIREDTILIINAIDGNLIKEINLVDIILNDFHFLKILNSSKNARCLDLLHTNDVRVINKEDFKKYFFFDKDLYNFLQSENLLLISLRDISTLIVLDPKTEKILWSTSNLMNNQHSPRLLPNGNILVFDNYAYDHLSNVYGHSAIREINPKKMKIVASLDGDENLNFSSPRRGKIQIIDNKVYVVISDSGFFVEYECSPNDKVFLNNCNRKVMFNLSNNSKNQIDSIFIFDIYRLDENKKFNKIN